MNTDYAPAKIVIGSKEFNNNKYGINSIEIITGSYDGNIVGIGSAFSPTCSVTMNNVNEIDVDVIFSIWIFLDEKWKSFGVYQIKEEPTRNGNEKMSFTGHSFTHCLLDSEYDGFRDGHIVQLGNKVAYEHLLSDFEGKFGTKLHFSEAIENRLKTEHPINIVMFKEKIDENGKGAENWKFVRISWREFLQALAILFGANVIERNGEFYIEELNKHVVTDTSFSLGYALTGYELSNKQYSIGKISIVANSFGLRSIIFSKEDTYIWDIFGPFPIPYGNGLKTYTFDCSGSVNTYEFKISCSWLGATIQHFNSALLFEDMSDEGTDEMLVDFKEENRLEYIRGADNVVYTPGSVSFAGWSEELYAGNFIELTTDDGKNSTFYIAQMTINWDGGITTTIECPKPSESEYGSSITSNISSSGVQNRDSLYLQGLMNFCELNFANITFSNVKDSTISGSKFIDGSIEGSKIDSSTFEDGAISGTAIDTSTFKDGSISGSSFVDGTIENSKIKDSTLTGAKIADATIGIEKVNESFIKDLTAKNAFIDNLTSTVAKINSLTAKDAIIRNIFSNKIVSDKAILDVLQANIINAEYIKSAVADVGYITADEADLSYANITLGNIDTANVDKANIGLLFNEVGLIDRATIVDGHITGFLDAVEINANNITAGTLIADRILLSGDNGGVLYALNNLGDLESTNIDTLDGYVLTDRTINADKIIAESITSNELDADEIFANSAILKKVSIGIANIVELDAGRITSGYLSSDRIQSDSITSSKLDTEEIFSNSAVIEKIFANDITATGTITGATLKGANAEITEGYFGGLHIAGPYLYAVKENKKLRIGSTSAGYGLSVEDTSSGEYTEIKSGGISIRTASDTGSLISRHGVYTQRLEADKIIGGKLCYDDTTSYGLYWSSESVLRPISSSYKVSLGSSSCPMSSIYATTLYEGGSLLRNKYAVVKTGTGSKKGTGGWTGITINFGVTFTTIPMFNVMFTNGFTTENISVTDISTTSATIWICALDKSWTYEYRWFAVGNIA